MQHSDNQSHARTSVLFVCLGNICRSTMADAVFHHLVAESGHAEQFHIDSAGTGSWHLGSPPHPETQAELVRRGIDPLAEAQARQVTHRDFLEFDYIVAMDSSNFADLVELQRRAGDDARAELSMLLEHADEAVVESVLGADARAQEDATGPATSVPDPYYVGGYDRVYELVRSGCEGLLESMLPA